MCLKAILKIKSHIFANKKYSVKAKNTKEKDKLSHKMKQALYRGKKGHVSFDLCRSGRAVRRPS